MKDRFIPTVLVVAIALILSACASPPKLAVELREDFLDWQFGMFIHFNVAPDTSGLIPEKTVQQLREIGMVLSE